MGHCHGASVVTRRVPRAAAVTDAPESVCASILTRQTLILENFPSTTHARALSPNGRVHWHVRNAAKSDLAAIVGFELNRVRLQPMRVPVRLRFRYVFPDKRQRDVDNLTTGVTKVVIDSLVRAEVLAADDSEHVTEVKAEASVEKGARRLEIVLEHADA